MMTEITRLKQTVLHSFHLELNANMAEFGGYHMPLWYNSGAKGEHLAVINQAGLFDTSHMAVITVTGTGAFKLLQHSFSRDLNRCIGKDSGPLISGRNVYGLFLKTDATVLDDAIIAQLGSDRYMVVVNSGMGGIISAHLKGLASTDAAITDYSDRLGKIDLQGPASALILQSLVDDPDSVLADLTYFTFKGDIFPGAANSIQLKDGTPILLSRTGYTGEFGFELFADKSDSKALWQAILTAGEPLGLIPCGLAARDSLRAGAMLPLSHQDIGDWTFGHTPWSFVLPWDENQKSFTKQFVGADRLLSNDRDYTYGYAGYDPRKISVSETSLVKNDSDEKIGMILTSTTDMAIDRVDATIVSIATPESEGRPETFRARGLSCGFIRTDRPCLSGDKVWLAEGKRKLQVEIRSDIRPDRTARCSMKRMRSK